MGAAAGVVRRRPRGPLRRRPRHRRSGLSASRVVVDLGSGPGSLAVRAARRFPGAHVVAVDHDPFLLALGAAVHDGVKFVSAHIGGPGWTHVLDVSGGVDAVVSSTALHYPAPTVLASIYRDCAGLLAAGGVLVNADQLPAADPALRVAMTSLDGRRHMPPPAGDWHGWWSAAANEPAFGDLLALRSAQTPVHSVDNDLSADDHRRLLAAAGFRASAVVWQRGASSVVAAVR